ncbi:MAG: hypothetical protein FWD34_10495 [Oscillospiraceae bacterium]|nr:hypothetical protein [Oscillospiraceae bacterium]
MEGYELKRAFGAIEPNSRDKNNMLGNIYAGMQVSEKKKQSNSIIRGFMPMAAALAVLIGVSVFGYFALNYNDDMVAGAGTQETETEEPAYSPDNYIDRITLRDDYKSGLLKQYFIPVRQEHIMPTKPGGAPNINKELCNNQLYFIIDSQRVCSTCGYIFTDKQNQEIGIFDEWNNTFFTENNAIINFPDASLHVISVSELFIGFVFHYTEKDGVNLKIIDEYVIKFKDGRQAALSEYSSDYGYIKGLRIPEKNEKEIVLIGRFTEEIDIYEIESVFVFGQEFVLEW